MSAYTLLGIYSGKVYSFIFLTYMQSHDFMKNKIIHCAMENKRKGNVICDFTIITFKIM